MSQQVLIKDLCLTVYFEELFLLRTEVFGIGSLIQALLVRVVDILAKFKYTYLRFLETYLDENVLELFDGTIVDQTFAGKKFEIIH